MILAQTKQYTLLVPEPVTSDWSQDWGSGELEAQQRYADSYTGFSLFPL